VLLGWTPPAAVDRGAIEAAARNITAPEGHRPWRIDVRNDDGTRAGRAVTRQAAATLRSAAGAHAVFELGAHKLLLLSPSPPPLHGAGLWVWPGGVTVPRRLDTTTVMIAACGAAAGVAALMGAPVVQPPGATGDATSNLEAKATAARAALSAGARRVVVHLGGADEAAHLCDAPAKVAFLERADAQIIRPLAGAARAFGATLTVCPDHGCDPLTGAHDAEPVPHLTWSGAATGPRRAQRFTERAVAHLPITDLTLSS
jgi:2,3-bisphosphoglycerate-independent phosphoglycerate mutase